MPSAALDTPAADLLWSLWTELGVNGVVRNHSWAAIDPEPLVVATPRVGRSDPRVIGEAARWCVAHADRLSVSRLEGLLDSSDGSTRAHFLEFADALDAQSAIKWPVEKWRTRLAIESTRVESKPRKRSKKQVEKLELPLRRAALFRVRMRALAGVGARADVLSELVARAATWTSATDLHTLGYSKRNVARVLAELEEAAVVRVIRAGSGFRYRLDASHGLAALVGPVPEAFPPWHDVFHHVIGILDLVEANRTPTVTSRVASTMIHDALVRSATALWLDAPPPIRGLTELPDELVAWATGQLTALAAGDSPALRRSTASANPFEAGGNLARTTTATPPKRGGSRRSSR